LLLWGLSSLLKKGAPTPKALSLLTEITTVSGFFFSDFDESCF
jgi:hypothetical protein